MLSLDASISLRVDIRGQDDDHEEWGEDLDFEENDEYDDDDEDDEGDDPWAEYEEEFDEDEEEYRHGRRPAEWN